MSDTHELKPCPFCGYHLTRDEGVCEKYGDDEEDPNVFTGICCPGCAAFLTKPSEHATIEEGIEAWNTRAALSASPAQPVAIKPLEWEVFNGCDEQFSDTAVGRYEVGQVGRFIIATVRRIKDGQWEDDVFAHCTSVEKAKAAAQSDYEARIRSALSVPLPEVEGGDKGDAHAPEGSIDA